MLFSHSATTLALCTEIPVYRLAGGQMNIRQVRDKESAEGHCLAKKRPLYVAIAKFGDFGGFLRRQNFFGSGPGLQSIPLVILRVLHIGRLGGRGH